MNATTPLNRKRNGTSVVNADMNRGLRGFHDHPFLLAAAGGCALLLAMAPRKAAADSTFVLAVQISVVTQTNPPQITLNWEPDPYGATNYSVFRKTLAGTNWGPAVASLSGTTLTYTDTHVTVGSAYEYQVIKTTTNYTGWPPNYYGYTGYGYVYAGIDAPLVDSRGKLLLIVATNATGPLSNELATLQSDLVGDGWLVTRHDVSSNDTPQDVREVITNDFYADPTNVDAVFLFGHVPVLESGWLDYDGHGPRSMPADTYYAVVSNDWPIPDNPTNGLSYLPSDAELMVGRVDLFDLPGNGTPGVWPNETEALRNYLDKDHLWRTHQIHVQRQALMGNRRGDVDTYEGMAASGYRTFEPCVGPGNTVEANIQDPPVPPDQRWISMLQAGSYLWAFGDGGGQDNAISYLGTNDADYDNVYSESIVGQDALVPFVMLFGSHLGAWDDPDDIMRSVLATPTVGLACCLSGEPHWFLHHMALGEPIGYSTRLTMNNTTLYQNESNVFTRAIYIALMGDPTLRLDPVAPPAGIQAAAGSGTVALTWLPSPDSVAGYHVYRATSPAGPFTRLTGSLLTGTNFTDTSAPPNSYTYMVRAVNLESHFSGSYYNPSEGIFVNVTAGGSLAITAHAAIVAGGLQVTWNSQAGTAYHVDATPGLKPLTWSNVSGPITGGASTSSWTDTNSHSLPARFYRVSSP
jgi:hypothetical protein